MEKNTNFDFISGGISGAITDPDSSKAREHAKLYYDEIRRLSTDVERIALYMDVPKSKIQQIKNYLFIDKHNLVNGFRRFDPSFEIAESWRRLAFDQFRVEPHDITLIKHELREMEYVDMGFSQDEAHIMTSRQYDYRKESDEYYESLRAREQRRAHKRKRSHDLER